MQQGATQRPQESSVYAGDFGLWLAGVVRSFREDVGTEVPCGTCRGCCTSSYFIPVRPTDKKTLQVVPRHLLSSAPGLPVDHKIIGIGSGGECALFVSGNCSIYSARPRTCRDYDCRIFTAAGVKAGGPDKRTIDRRVQNWQFSYACEQDVKIHQAIKTAAAFVAQNRSAFPDGRAPTSTSDIAVLAIKVYGVFLEPRARSPSEMASAIIAASRAFDA